MDKKIGKWLPSLIAAFSITSSCAIYAAYPTLPEEKPVEKDYSGFYIGGQIGWGYMDIEDANKHIPYRDEFGDHQFIRGRVKTSDEDGLAGHVYIGYDINQYIGVELGGSGWSDGDIKITPNPAIARAKGDISASSIDLMLKGQYAFSHDKYYVFGKAGFAYIYWDQDVRAYTNPAFAGIALPRSELDHSVNTYRPKLEIGFGWRFKEHWSAFVSYSRLFGRGNDIATDSYVPSLDQATVGVQYKFA